MTVNISAEWTEVIREKVASGAYASVDAVLDEALRVWQLHADDADNGDEALRREVGALIDELDSGASTGREYPAIRAAVQVGVNQLDRGEGIPGEMVRDEMLRRSEARRLAKP